MTGIEKQVTSLDLAKQLKEAGYKQEGLWWWVEHGSDRRYTVIREGYFQKTDHPHIVAPTVAELGEKLPGRIKVVSYSGRENSFLHCRKWIDCKKKVNYNVEYSGAISYAIQPSVQDYTEANARAKMWLYLKKEGLLET